MTTEWQDVLPVGTTFEDMGRAVGGVAKTGMSSDEIESAISSAGEAGFIRRQLKRASGSLPSEPTASTDTATITIETATTYTNPTVIGKDDDNFAVNGANMVEAGATYPNYLYNVQTGTITGENTLDFFYVSFFIHSDSFELSVKEINSKWDIFVDGALLDTVSMTSTGALRWVKVQFGDTKLRRIDIPCWNGFFGGFNIPNTATMYPTAVQPKVIVVGDSYTEGAGATNNLLSFVPSLNWMTKGFNIWNSGSGGTGYVNPNTGGDVNFVDRVQSDVIDNNPNVVITAGGINDLGYTALEFQTNVDLYYSLLKAGLPSATIVIVSPWYPRSSTITLEFKAILEAKAVEIGAVFIDVTGDGFNGYFTGTGYAGNPQLDGNADLLISVDGTHPNDDGYLYIAHRIGTALIDNDVI